MFDTHTHTHGMMPEYDEKNQSKKSFPERMSHRSNGILMVVRHKYRSHFSNGWPIIISFAIVTKRALARHCEHGQVNNIDFENVRKPQGLARIARQETRPVLAARTICDVRDGRETRNKK